MAKVALDYSFAAGTTAKGTEVKANDDALAAGVNDIIDEQINAAADIDGSKLLDASVPAAKLSTSGLLNTQGFKNLLNQGNFTAWAGGTDAVPDGWTLHLTPTIAQDTKPTGSPVGYSCKITAAGAGSEGIKQTIPCRASTVYSYALYENCTAGDTIQVYLVDNGGTPAEDSNEYTDTSWTRKNDTITTAADATELTIYIKAKTDGDIVWCGEVVITEGSLLKQFTPDLGQADYDSGWFAVTRINLYTKAHGLAVRPSRVKLMYRRADDSTVYFEISGSSNDGSGNMMGAAIGYNTANIYVYAESTYVNPWGSATIEATDGANVTSGQYRILAWKG